MTDATDPRGELDERPAARSAAADARTAVPARSSSRSRRDNVIAAALLALLAVGFLAAAWPRITGPIADSDEGINAAVWGYNSRGLRELGIVDSRLGGVRVDGTKYATHPPLIVLETALIEQVVGEHPWSTRAAAWLGSLASIVLIFLLVRALGLGPPVAAAATVAAMTGHMLFVYGAMLDTMVTAFPFALAVALVWYRQWTDQGSPSPWLILPLATIASLGGWQATFLVGLCGVSTLARIRHDRGALRRALPYLAGVVLGVALTLGWAYWVYGSFSVLGEKLGRRTGGDGVTIPSMVTFQLPWLAQLLGIGFLAWVACAVSLRDRRYRPLAALSLASVIVYALFLKEGSGGHQYWNYWGLLPAAIGVAYVFHLTTTALRRRARRQPLLPLAAVLAMTFVIVAVNLTRPNQAGDLIEDGYASYALVAAAPLAPGQRELPYVAEPYRIDDWARYRGSPEVRPVLDAEQLRALARDHPDHQVLVLGTCDQPDPTGVCEIVTFGPGTHPASVAPALVRADDLVRRLDASG